MSADAPDVVRGGAELVRADTRAWLTARDIAAPLVVFVHGFTSHGRYLGRLAEHVGAHGWAAALFNYDSYRGIDRAAAELDALLLDVADPLRERGLFLIGHSMGGLVARYFAAHGAEPTRRALRGIATLGTPHRGTLSRKLVSRLLDWGDAITLPNPFARLPACRAAQQLTGADAERLVATLNARAAGGDPQAPLLSIAGGLAYLEFGDGESGGFSGALRNMVLQRLIGERPNDGLVGESSSDATRAVGGRAACAHRRDYAAYETINHTHLTQNQQVAGILLRWLRDVVAHDGRAVAKVDEPAQLPGAAVDGAAPVPATEGRRLVVPS